MIKAFWLHLPWSGGLVQFDSFFLFKPPKYSYCLYRLLIVLHSLLAQRVVKGWARHIHRFPQSAHITPLPFDPHWLPINSRIQYKIALTFSHTVSGTAPPYPVWVASSLFFSLSSLSFVYSALPCSEDGREYPGREILSTHRNCDLEDSSSLC